MNNLLATVVIFIHLPKEYWTHTGCWGNLWDHAIEQSVEIGELKRRSGEITIDQVRAWVEKHGNIEKLSFL